MILLQYQFKGGATPGTPTVPLSNGKFQYSPSKYVRSSAAVVNSSGVLVKLLWINESYEKGTYTKVWDGKDDLGNSVSTGTYNVIFKNHNLGAGVKGIIGNNSVDSTGSGVWRGFQFIHSLAFTSSFGYYALGYNEGWSSIGKFSVSQPLRKIPILETRQTNAVVHYVCTDGTYVYWAAYDPAATTKSFVFATKCSDDTEVNFSSATDTSVNFGAPNGRTYKAINIVNAANSQINGMAIASTCLLVCRENGTVIAVNRTTGAVMNTNSITGAGKIATDGGTNVWIQIGTEVKKYTVNSGGVLTLDSTTIAGLTAPLDLKFASNTLSIIDNSVVKHFNLSGSQTGTLGSGASYVTDPNVSDNKFYFKVSDGFKPFISYQTDGAIWVGDVGNCRVQKFTGTTYVSSIRFLPHNYNVSIEATQGNRTFVDFMEYNTADLSNPANCPLVRNYEASAPSGYNELWHTMEWPLTFSNGKTYAWLKHTSTHLPKCFEVPTDGPMRNADTKNLPAHSVFVIDPTSFALRVHTKSGGNMIITEYTLTGTPSDNPTWGTGTVLATVPIVNYKPEETDIEKVPQKTTGGYLVIYGRSKSTTSNKYHLGSFLAGDTDFKWMSQRTLGTTYAGDRVFGRFDDANQVNYPGGNVFVQGRFIYTVYKGENWKQSQTNFWDLYSEDGIPLVPFGSWKTTYTVEALPEVAGNVTTGGVILRGGKHYIVHNDESIHGGAMVWEVTGLDTIETVTTTVKTPDAVVATNIQISTGWTTAEVKEFQDRWNNLEGKGVYLSQSDSGRTNSPKDKDLVLQYANSLKNNNTISTWKTLAGNPVPAGATPSPVGNGIHVACAALAWWGYKDSNPTLAATYLNAAKAGLADQVNNGADMRDSVWEVGVIGDANPGFEICHAYLKFFEGYELIKDQLTSGERIAYDAYFYGGAKFWVDEGNLRYDTKFANRWGGNYTVTASNVDNEMSSWYTHKNGNQIPTLALWYNNRPEDFYKLGHVVGHHLKRTNASGYNTVEAGSEFHGLSKADFLIRSGEMFIKEWLMFQVFPDGSISEMERNRDTHEKGTNYTGNILTNIMDMLDIDYRAGGNLYQWSTTGGHLGTASSTPKTFKLPVDWFVKRIFSRRYPLIYDYFNPTQVLDGISSTSNYVFDVPIGTIGYKLWKDIELKQQSLRMAPKNAYQDGSNPLPAEPNGSGFNYGFWASTGNRVGRSIRYHDAGMNDTTMSGIDVFNVTR